MEFRKVRLNLMTRYDTSENYVDYRLRLSIGSKNKKQRSTTRCSDCDTFHYNNYNSSLSILHTGNSFVGKDAL